MRAVWTSCRFNALPLHGSLEMGEGPPGKTARPFFVVAPGRGYCRCGKLRINDARERRSRAACAKHRTISQNPTRKTDEWVTHRQPLHQSQRAPTLRKTGEESGTQARKRETKPQRAVSQVDKFN